MIKSVEGSAGFLHNITKPIARRGGAQILKEEEEKVLDRCEAKRKEWAKHWCDESVRNLKDKPWKDDESTKMEEVFPRLKECELEKVSRLYKTNTGVGCDDSHPKFHLELVVEKTNKRRSGGVIGKDGTAWQFSAKSLHDYVFLDPEEGHG